MKILKASIPLGFTLAMLVAAGCSSETGAPQEEGASQESSEAKNDDVNVQVDTDQVETKVSPGGRCCYGSCNNQGGFMAIKLTWVTSDCRAAIVNYCHATGRNFGPNGDAFWSGC